MLPKNNAHPAEAKVSAIQNGVDSPITTAESKVFTILSVKFTLRSIGADGSHAFWAERWGLARYLPSLHDAALFLAQIGGRV